MTKYQRYRQTPKGKAANHRASRKYYWSHREKELARATATNRRLRYGVTQEQYDAMFEKQNGLCAVCGQFPNGRRLAVDHNHRTEAIRELLCGPCNSALGLVGDDPERLSKLIVYLERHNGEPGRRERTEQPL